MLSLETWEIAVKVGLAALLAGVIGAEREWTGKEAGLRTHMLIAVGAALLTDVSVHVGDRFSQGSQAWDPGRIAAQIVSGVGFLGAGSIIQSRGGVRGLTTAAGIWVAAAIGLAVGAEFYVEASMTTGVLLVILVTLKPVEEKLLRRDLQRLVLELPPHATLRDLSAHLEDLGVEVRKIQVSGKEGHRLVHLTLRGKLKDRDRVALSLEDAGYDTSPSDD